MKKILGSSVAAAALVAATGAFAADLPVYVEPVEPAPVVAVPLWTGFYVGAQVGAAFFDHGDDDCAYDGVSEGDVDDLLEGEYDSDWFTGKDGVSCSYFDDFGAADTYFAIGSEFNEFEPGGGDGDDTAWFAGAHVGYDHQMGSFVIGAVLDANWVGSDDDDASRFDADIYRYAPEDGYNTGLLDGNVVLLAPAPYSFTGDIGAPTIEWSEGGIDWYGTARLRAGWAVGRALIYATGGLAFGGGDEGEYTEYYSPGEAQYYQDNVSADYFEGCEEASLTDTPTTDGPIPDGYICSGGDDDDDTRWGYALGGGIDFLVTDNVSVGAEALYVNLDGGDGFGGIFDEDDDDDSDLDFWTLGVKASYRFGG